MNNHVFQDRNGNTPLDPEQIKGLKFSHFTTMAELDEAEDINIQEGLAWLERQNAGDFLSSNFLNKLHKKLFGNVWNWAGTFRKINVNLSKVEWYNVAPDLINFFEDAKLWTANSKLDADEMSAEFHHRLVSIHPYPNGNGRTSRIMTEYMQKRCGLKVSSWMASLKNSPKVRRDKYIHALKMADKADYRALINFMREKC
ncbi:MAG: mobile mystery protein B [Bdellovibrio sp.]|nr:mobile mystery protein B [Bdellovibrio sp.]